MTKKLALPVVASVLAGALIAGFASSAFADVKLDGATAPKVDDRRTKSGAAITGEIDSGADPRGAQDGQRLADSYRPKGIDLGQFLLMPKLETEEAFNSNVYATRRNVKADMITAVRPEVTLRSRFDQHEFDVHFLAEQFLFKTFSREDHFDVTGDVNGRYDIDAGTEVTGMLQAFARHEDRTSPDDVGGRRPTPTQGFVGKIGGKHEAGLFSIVTEVSPQRLTFEGVEGANGAFISNSDRNRWEVEGKLRGSYEIFPAYSAVAQVSGNTRQYDHMFDRTGYQRSSTGYRIESGVGFDISQLLRGDVLVGYLEQDYQDKRFKSPSGFSFRSTLNWTPDKLTIVVPALERSVAETTTALASSLVRNTASVLVRHELARNIMLSGFASVSYEELTGLRQSDWIYEGRLKATYAFAPEVYVGAEVGYRDKEAVVDVSSYQQGLFMVRLGLQL